MKKVAVLGNTGMLGHMVQKVLSKNSELNVVGFGRESLELKPRTLNQMGTALSTLLGFDVDYVINCMGATKPYFMNCADLSIPIYANSLFPHQLAQWASLLRKDTRVIHITTDCVFDGKVGQYDEEDVHTPPDLYGKSKSLGESDRCMVIRTSIIGPEINGNNKHFFNWVKSLDGRNKEKSFGFTNHLWNGLTTLELSYILNEIITSDLYENNTFHLFSSDISKYHMIKVIASVYGLDINVEPTQANSLVDRRLRTVEDLNKRISPQPFLSMIQELRDFERVE